jgi:hypothetical protein
MHRKNAERERCARLLPSLKVHASLSCVVINQYNEDSDQVFGELTEFL